MGGSRPSSNTPHPTTSLSSLSVTLLSPLCSACQNLFQIVLLNTNFFFSYASAETWNNLHLPSPHSELTLTLTSLAWSTNTRHNCLLTTWWLPAPQIPFFDHLHVISSRIIIIYHHVLRFQGVITPNRHLDLSSHVCTAHPCDRQTLESSIAIVCALCIRCSLIIIIIIINRFV